MTETDGLVFVVDDDAPKAGSSIELTSFGPRNVEQSDSEYLTESEMRRRERENLFAVLQKASGKIKGVDGAAELLGVKPTTLSSRIEKFGLKRPAGRNAQDCEISGRR
jgi:transcriptional regulator with GAF, ATPase, and Fis domain